MRAEYHKWWSPALGRDMELKVYGHAGRPILIFPSSGGRFFEYEDFGMVEACRRFLKSGRIRIFAVDSVDQESWLARHRTPRERAERHEAHERYLLTEVVPFIRHLCPGHDRVLASGCSLGAFHAANFLFRHPEACDGIIALSGLYGPHYLLGQPADERLYYFFPLEYLPGLTDQAWIAPLRQSRIIICVGQGPWERCDDYDCIAETRALKDILATKRIPAWVDFWGHDVSHDWPWWRIQMPYFLEKLDG